MKHKEQYTKGEIAVLKRLNTPVKIQDYLETLKINFETKGETCQSPRRVLRSKTAHCMEGALLAAAALEFHTFEPLVMDLRSQKPQDDDHVVVVFKQFGCFGAVSKTNHAVLKYREPVYKSIRELALSFFHEYFTHDGKKTLREFSELVNLKRFDAINWRTSEEDLWPIPEYLDKVRHSLILNKTQIKNLRKADPIEILAGKLVVWKKK